jgi:hypothetical protein
MIVSALVAGLVIVALFFTALPDMLRTGRSKGQSGHTDV